MDFGDRYYDDNQCEFALLRSRMSRNYFFDEFGDPYLIKPKNEVGGLYVKDTSRERRLKEKLEDSYKREREARERAQNAILEAEAAKQRVDLMVSAKLAQLESVHEKPVAPQPQEETKIEVPNSPQEVVKEKEVQEDAVKEIQEEKQEPDGENDDEDECVICMDVKPAMVFVPCGHFITCSVCCKVETCPKCRAVIQTRVKLYR